MRTGRCGSSPPRATSVRSMPHSVEVVPARTVREKRGHVEADAAGADDGDALARLARTATADRDR